MLVLSVVFEKIFIFYLKFFMFFWPTYFKTMNIAGSQRIEFDILNKNLLFSHFWTVDLDSMKRYLAEDYDPLKEALEDEQLKEEAIDYALKNRRASLKAQQDLLFTDPFLLYDSVEDREEAIWPFFLIEDYYDVFKKQSDDLYKLHADERWNDFINFGYNDEYKSLITNRVKLYGRCFFLGII
jgi:hypothetical protein